MHRTGGMFMLKKIMLRILSVLTVLSLVFIPAAGAWNLWGLIMALVILIPAAVLFISTFMKTRVISGVISLLGMVFMTVYLTAAGLMEGPGYLFDPTAGSPAAGVWTALALFALAFIICIVRRKRKKKKAEGDRYCPQCGEKLSGSAAFCRRCGCRLDPPGGENGGKKDGGGPGWPRGVAAILCLIVILTGMFGTAVSSGLIDVPFLTELGKVSDASKFTALTGNFTNIAVTDGESAIAAAQDASAMLGFENAADELTSKNTTVSGEYTYYRLQQNYQGIPVYGRTFVVAADAQGNARGITANASDTDTSVSLEASLTQEQAEASVAQYIEDNFADVDTASLSVDELSEDKLAIYDLDNEEPALVYVLGVYAQDCSAEVLISASDGHIVLFNDLADYVQSEFTCQGQEKEQEFIAEQGDSENSMVYESPSGTQITVSVPGDGHKYDWYYDENHDVVTWKGEEAPDKSAVDAMANITGIYGYFYETFERDSFSGEGEDISVFVHVDGYRSWSNERKDMTNNAFYWPSPNGSVIAFCRNYDDSGASVTEYSAMADVSGHEYMHGIVRYTSGLSNTSDNEMPDAVNEALGDIMGYCAEAYINGGEIDWTSSVRTSYEGRAESSGYIYHMDDYNDSTSECHTASTIISHAACLMYTGLDGKEESLSREDIEKLWYNANLIFPSDCTFSTVRECVEMTADMLGFSEEKKDCIEAAFDEVGIDGRQEDSEEYSPDMELTVLDREGAQYDDYTVNVEGERKTGLFGLFHEDYSDEIKVSDSGPVELGLPEGTYIIKVSDNVDSTRVFSRTVEIKDGSGRTDLSISTNFGMDYTVSSPVQLSVYDINNVRYGEYTLNIYGTVDREEGVSEDYEYSMDYGSEEPVRLDLEAGKYTFTLRDLQDSSKTKEFTVRVKAEALVSDLKVSTDFGHKAGEFSEAAVPPGAQEFDGHYYYIYRFEGDVDSWEEAKAFCEERGGYLATATSDKENEFIWTLLDHFGYSRAFFGMYDAGYDEWKWANGETFGYSGWADGEPGFSGGRYGVYYQGGSEEWHSGDVGYGTELAGTGFICEWGEYEMADAEVVGTSAKRTTSDERDIVLVLDVSGSMDGEPIEETIDASVKFVDSVLEEDASIGVVTYSSQAGVISDFSMDRDILETSITQIGSGGGTNMEDGLSTAYEMLSYSNARKRIIVLMSDGMPNQGKEGEELTAYADGIKEDDVYIYTLGFFSSLSESEKASAQSLLEDIASEGCHYEVDSAENLRFFFNDIADQISGQQYIYIRIACPVDVKVTCNGETLDSSEESLNTRTDFGTLTFEESGEDQSEETDTGQDAYEDTGQSGALFGILNQTQNGDDREEETDDRIKVLRLKDNTEYDIEIEGTGEGTMDYTIGFMDDTGEYSDFRRFEDINITRTTEIDTVAKSSGDTFLNVDEDGDGRYDLRYRAGANGVGEIVDYTYLIFIAAGAAAVLVILITILVIRRKIKKRRMAGK